MKKLCLVFLLTGFFVACSKMDMVNPLSIDSSSGNISSSVKERILNGTATASDLQMLIQRYHDNGEVKEANGLSGHEVLTIPKTGRLLVTLRDNDAGWRSELYMTIGSETILLFSDTREGPLNVTTEYAYLSGTPVGFFLVTHTPNGYIITNSANSIQCRVDYYPSVPKWILNFEDIPASGYPGLPSPDWDYNDAVIEVQMAEDPIVDISDCICVSIDYLDPVGYTPDGYTIYYIGQTLNFNVNIDILNQHELLAGNPFTVYAIHEYYEDETCYRWWYPGEPKEISVKKGDPLPGYNNPYCWTGVDLSSVGRTVLNGSYTSTLEVAAGLDQTHVIIVRENAQGQIEMTVYDNDEAGIFDPPPLN